MSEMSDEVKLHVVNAAAAREQASEGTYSFLRSEFRRAKPTAEHPDGEVFEIPHKDLFDLDQQERWDDLQAEQRKYDREPDVKAPNGTLIAKGQIIYPHQINEERVRPSWPERLGIVLWGEEGAKRARAGGINFNEIEIIWSKQMVEMQKRLRDDSKSAAGSGSVAAESDGDRS